MKSTYTLVKRFHCSFCFNIVTRTVEVEDGAYVQPAMFCVGRGLADLHRANIMAEMITFASTEEPTDGT